MSDYSWLVEARRHIGLEDIPGERNSSVILSWLDALRAWWHDDETPWCGTFVAHCLQFAGYSVPKGWMRALDWAEWGRAIDAPMTGCVVIFKREGGGHVGFIVGQDTKGNLLVLGGNQGNKVSIAAFPRYRVVAYRWPAAVPFFGVGPLPVLAAADFSKSEA